MAFGNDRKKKGGLKKKFKSVSMAAIWSLTVLLVSEIVFCCRTNIKKLFTAIY